MRWRLMEVNVVNHMQALPDQDAVTTQSRGQNILYDSTVGLFVLAYKS